MSQPHWKGRQFTGVAKVLSIMRGTPWAWARLGKLLDIQDGEGRVGDGLAKDRLGVGPEGGVQLLLRALGIHEGELDAMRFMVTENRLKVPP